MPSINLGRVVGPEGPQGEKGDTALSVTVGTTTTLSPGTNANVENVGTSQDLILNFEIPRGDTGEQGIQGPQGPQGPKGETGSQGPQGEPGHTPLKGVDYFTEEDINSLNIPTKTSELINDSDFTNKEYVDGLVGNINTILASVVNGE